MRPIRLASLRSNYGIATPVTICLPEDAANSRPRLAFVGFRGWPARVTAEQKFDAYAAAIVATSAIVLAAPLIALAELGLGPFSSQ